TASCMRSVHGSALLLAVVVFACGEDGQSSPDGTDGVDGGSRTSDGATNGPSSPAPNDGGGEGSQDSSVIDGSTSVPSSLAARYPGDVNMENDPAVVWIENFEEGSIAAFTSRYSSVTNPAGMVLNADVPAKSSGSKSITLTSKGNG